MYFFIKYPHLKKVFQAKCQTFSKCASKLAMYGAWSVILILGVAFFDLYGRRFKNL